MQKGLLGHLPSDLVHVQARERFSKYSCPDYAWVVNRVEKIFSLTHTVHILVARNIGNTANIVIKTNMTRMINIRHAFLIQLI